MLRFLVLAVVLLIAPFSVLAKSTEWDEDVSTQYTNDIFDWMLGQDVLDRTTKTAEPAALAEVAKLFRDGHPRASVALQNYLKRFPRDPAAFDIAGMQLLREQEYKAAVTSFERSRQLDPGNPWTQAKLGTAMLLADQFDKGIKMLEKVVEEDPFNPLARRYLAWSSLRVGDLPNAILHSEAALNAFGLPIGTVNRAHLDLATMYRQAGQPIQLLHLLGPAVRETTLELPPQVLGELYGLYLDAALTANDKNAAGLALTRLRRLGVEDAPQFRIGAARTALLNDQPEQAYDMLEALVRDVPALQLDLVPDIARAQAAKGDVDGAVDRLEGLAAVKGPGADLPILREVAAMLLSEKGPEAASAFSAEVFQKSDRPDLQHLAVEVSLLSGDAEAALERAETLVATSPDFAPGHWIMATILLDAGRKDEGVAALWRTVELEPQSPGAWLALIGSVHGHETYAHEDNASHDDVEEIMAQAIAANPHSAVLHQELGLLRLSDGELDGAIEAFDEALRNSPGYLPALTLGALARADTGENLDQARALIRLARTIATNNGIITDIAGWVEFKDGKPDAALALYEDALAISPDDTTTLYHKAVALKAKAETEQARDLYIKALAGGDMYIHYQNDARAALTEIEPGPVVTVPLFRIGEAGAGEELGQLTFNMVESGKLEVSLEAAGLPEGLNAAHVHMYPTCAPKDGAVGGAAGAHYGHDHAAMTDGGAVDHAAMGHAMPAGDATQSEMKEMTPKPADAEAKVDHAAMGHAMPGDMAKPKGDLDPFTVAADGVSRSTVVSERLTLDEIRGRSLMIHQGPDVDGKSGPKIACAVIH
jgi:tetratricopeptide (TPR) repeat protein/Cu/Zn superoxide dismutase